MRITIHVATKNRHTELALLLQSLRTQTYQKFDVIILDDASDTPVANAYFLNYLINRLKLEDHRFQFIRRDQSFGVCNARNFIIENDRFNNDAVCRLDDDVIIEPDYLEKLVHVLEEGYDIASGVTPPMANPDFEREVSFVKPFLNRVETDKDGKLTNYTDDCGMSYLSEEILPANEFRSCALMKKSVIEKIEYPKTLTTVGFREEAFFSLKAQNAGFKIGVNTSAKAYHLLCPLGGVRDQEYQQKVQTDQKTFEEFVKKNWRNKKCI